MSRVETATGMDRLPWLPDDPQPKAVKRRGGGGLLAWAAAVILAVAGAGFWMGLRSVGQQSASVSHHGQATTTVPVPKARPATAPEVGLPAQPQVAPIIEPQVRPAPAHEVRIAVPPAVRAAPRQVATGTPEAKAPQKVTEQAEATPAPAIAQSKAPYVVPKPWPSRVATGAAGRLVQIGAFGSIHQAKIGWRYMVRAYPAVAHLQAVVRPARNSKGRIFYRFQIGTTSQAHSEVLCQRMQTIRFSCAVVGLPWKAKVER